jgi:hypothetical protein
VPVSHRALRIFVATTFGALLLNLPVHAASKGDIGLGYSRTGSNIFYPNTPGLNGWDLDGQIHWKTFIGVEGDVAHYGLGANDIVPRTTSVLFGPKVSVGAAGFKLFGHFLMGGEHSANSEGPGHISGGSFAYALGAGVDVPIVPLFAWRVQIDRLSAPSQSPSNGTPVRFTTGIVFRF